MSRSTQPWFAKIGPTGDFVVVSLLAVCVLDAAQTAGQQTFTCPGVDNPNGCGTYVDCNNGRVEKACSASTPDCDQGADYCLQHCTSGSGAGDNEDDVAVASADDCEPEGGRGNPPADDKRIPAWKGKWADRTATYTGIGQMTRQKNAASSSDDQNQRCAHCTGFAIAGDFILTAAHCVQSSTLPVKKIAVGRVGDDKKTYVATVDMKKCRWPSQYHGNNDWQFDYAICIIPKSTLESVTKFSISTPVTTETHFTGVNIAGYPIKNYPNTYANLLKLPFQLGSDPSCRVDVNPAPDNRKTLNGYKECTVSPGQSGAPIFNNATIQVYGILAKNSEDGDFKPYGPALTQSVLNDLNNYKADLNK